MLGKTLGLDISEDTICGVLVRHRLREHRIAGCAVVTNDSGADQAAALGRLVEELKPQGAACISAVFGPRILYRNLSLPFSDLSKVRATAAFELEAMLPLPVEELLVDFTVTGQGAAETQVLAAAVSRAYLGEHLAALAGQDLNPEVLDIRGVPAVSLLMRQQGVPASGLFIDLDRRQATVILFLEKRVVMIRRLAFAGQIFHGPAGAVSTPEAEAAVRELCRAINNTLMAFVDQTDEQRRPARAFATGSAMLYPDMAELLSRFLELEVEPFDLRARLYIEPEEAALVNWEPMLMDNALALALRGPGQGAGFNFRREEFAAKKPSRFRRDIRRGAVLLAVIASLALIDLGMDYHFLRQRCQALDSQIRAIFTRSLPEVARIVDPVQQLQAKVNEVKKSAGAGAFGGQSVNHRVLDLLDDVSQRIPASLNVMISRVVIDPDGLQLKGSTDTFNTVDNIKQGLDNSKLFRNVTISSANQDRAGGRVLFEISAQFGE